MANEQLDAFLAEESGAPASAPEPAPSPDPMPSVEAPEPSLAASQGAKEPAKEEASQGAKEPAKEASQGEDEPPTALEGEPIVPRRAFETIRRERQDWKEKAAKAEGENGELRRRLEALEKAAQTPPTPPQAPPRPLPPLDPVNDPAGFVQRFQNAMLNERLNVSEAMLRRAIGNEAVDAVVADFRQAASENPSLYDQLYQQPDPYGWAQTVAERHRTIRDVGADPAAYRERIIAEARAKWEAEQAEAARTVTISPAAGRQPSLATARSVGARSQAWSGEPSLEDVLGPIQNRKSTNGARRTF